MTSRPQAVDPLREPSVFDTCGCAGSYYFLLQALPIVTKGECMTDGRDERQEEFLSKAREAEAHAARTTDTVLQESWKRIAESYRALARTQAVLNSSHLTKWRPNFVRPEETATPR